MEILTSYPWHGNLRELKSVIKRALLFSDEITPLHLQFILEKSKKDEEIDNNTQHILPLKQSARNAEKQTIINALKITKGNKTRAAKILQITYRSLLSKLKGFGIN